MTAANEIPTRLFEERLAKTLEPLTNVLVNHPVYRRLSLRPNTAGIRQTSNHADPRPAHGTNHATNRSGEYCLGTAAALAAERGESSSQRLTENMLTPLRVFMESHVFAVWDFMSLVKTLQQRLTCVRAPWHPPADPISARLINEIVLGEETDDIGQGQYASHFELYLTAMEEVGADTTPIRIFLEELRAGSSVATAMARTDIQSSTKAFVMNTMATVSRQTHEVAASFLLGRESVIPLMFEQVLETTTQIEAPTFNWYLKRHIELDGAEHGPAGWRLLARLCGSDATRWSEAELSAKRALHARRALWDGVCESLEERGSHAFIAC